VRKSENEIWKAAEGLRERADRIRHEAQVVGARHPERGEMLRTAEACDHEADTMEKMLAAEKEAQAQKIRQTKKGRPAIGADRNDEDDNG